MVYIRYERTRWLLDVDRNTQLNTIFNTYGIFLYLLNEYMYNKHYSHKYAAHI